MPRIQKKASDAVPAAAATPTPAAAPAPAASTAGSKKKNGGRGAGIDRSQFKYAVWAGNSRKPIAFLNSQEEVKKTINGLKGSQLKSVTVGELLQVEVSTTAKIKGW